MLLDLKALAAVAPPTLAPVQSGHANIPSTRRTEVLRLLSNLDTASLPDWKSPGARMCRCRRWGPSAEAH